MGDGPLAERIVDAVRSEGLPLAAFIYLAALIADGAVRFDLGGLAVEPVSPEHRECAIAMKAELALNLARA
jgi:hypothetical protein